MNTINIITFVIIGLIILTLLLVGFFAVSHAIYTHKQIKKSSNTLTHFIELVKGNMDKDSLNDILYQFDKEVTFNVGSVVYFRCHNSLTSQYKALRNIILHRIELIEMIDKHKEELLQNTKSKKQ